ncbi:MAG: hypothetical protein M5U12_15730 [Verrucomicrobia bacterium]|nr:hypothetical protein [Verrucomicrobiota bacterium]
MNNDRIDSALAEIASESDPTLKHLKLASLVSAVYRECGIQLVVVGGSAIEFYTEGAYVSGDLDLCVEFTPQALTARLRQELMARLGGTGGHAAGRWPAFMWMSSRTSRISPARRSDGSRVRTARCGLRPSRS